MVKGTTRHASQTFAPTTDMSISQCEDKTLADVCVGIEINVNHARTSTPAVGARTATVTRRMVMD